MVDGDTKYFFVKGIDFGKFCEGFSKDYNSLKVGKVNGCYEVGDAIVSLNPVHKAILIKDFSDGLDKYLENKFNCKLY